MSYSQDFPFGIMDIVELLHLRIRRRGGNSVYADCPFCGDQRGKMNINYVRNVWRCNYCDESGGMLALYAECNNTTKSNAYWEICDALHTGDVSSGYTSNGKQPGTILPESKQISNDTNLSEIPQSPRAGISEIHQTLSLLFRMLSLSEAHRKHLSSPKRGLSEQQINDLGYKSTPPPFLCRSLTSRLLKQGCTVQGVPGFYQDDSGKWTINFNQRTSGILIPAVGIDGMIHGCQIMLDIPMKDKNDPPEKKGTKYIWFSSSHKKKGVTSGSPVHFVGNPFARTIYLTEGLLKADIAHCLMNRSFIGIAGANNVQALDPLFALLAQNGTELVVEAHDMDKYNNKMTNKGASKVHLTACSNGLECRTLTWTPNYKGIDDWQLALRQKEKQTERKQMNFKQKYISGLCGFRSFDDCVAEWRNRQEDGMKLAEYLGLTDSEYDEWLRDGNNRLKELLALQRQNLCFRIYQLDFGENRKTIPFAFLNIDALHKAGYEQPPAADYRLVCDDHLICPQDYSNVDILNQIRNRYKQLPEHYQGRPLSPSDIVELHRKNERNYFYCNTDNFVQVRFSPFLAKSLAANISTPEDTD